MEMVDSNEKKLNIADIASIALKNTGSKYSPKVAFPALLTEMTQPNTDVKQLGNTVFILHKGDKGQGFFRALNADKARNFVENGKQYAVYAKKLGMNMLVTEFEDLAISTLFHVIFKKPPMPGMGFTEYKLKSGGRRIVLNLGK